MVELWFLFSAYCPMKLYICTKFHENIDDIVFHENILDDDKVIERTQFL